MKLSNSHDKMNVTVKKVEKWDNKYWVLVELLNSNKFYPSFEDIYRIISAICWCENNKYPTGKGAKMVSEFLTDCCKGIPFELLKEKYKIPER